MKSSVLLIVFFAISICAAKNSICYKCKSKEWDKCHLTVTNQALLETCTDGSGCYTELKRNFLESLFHTNRGCLSSKTEECSGDLCSKCRADKCNGQIFPKDRHTCNTCSSETECARPMVAQPCKMYSKDNKECVTLFSGRLLETVKKRACVVDLSLAESTTCDFEKSLECTKCGSKDCNIVTESKGFTCFSCTGLSCYDIPTASANKNKCYDGCYTGVNTAGHSVRDCIDDREAENCGTEDDGKSKCIKCKANDCNKEIFPKDRLKCHVCSGKGCKAEESSKQHCRVGADDLACVTIFDSLDVIERGCSSELSAEGAKTCTSDEDCSKCTTNYCNTEIARVVTCKVCNSTDPNCVYNLSAIEDKACDAQGCYNLLLDDGTIKRGCAKDLKENECKEEGCEICKKSQCNDGIFPKDRHTCNTCNSEEECVTGMMAQPCILYASHNKECVTLFTGRLYETVKKRACAVDLSFVESTTCDFEKSFECTKCGSKDCNTVTESKGFTCFDCAGISCYDAPKDGISKKKCYDGCYTGVNALGHSVRDCIDGREAENCGTDDDWKSKCIKCKSNDCNKNIFPEDRLKCHVCTGNLCTWLSPESTKRDCRVGEDELACVTIFEDMDVIERGCSSELSSTSVETCTSDEDCSKCTTNYCNTQLTRNLKCKVCNSATDSNCIHNLSTVKDMECDALGCYNMLLKDGNIERGCTKDLKDDMCKNDDCEVCKKNKCNVGVFPTDRATCYKCNTRSEICLKPPVEKSALCVKYKKDGDCVTIFDKFFVEKRACKSDLAEEDLQKCDGKNPECQICGEKNCNTLEVRPDDKCVVCSQTAGKSECLRGADNIESELCAAGNDGNCYSRIKNRVMDRGCAVTLPVNELTACLSESNDNCMMCTTGNGCNTEIVPKDRIACHKCDSESNEDCIEEQKDAEKAEICDVYEKDDKCYSLVKGAGVVERGCQSDKEEDPCKGLDKKECKSCSKPACNKESEKTIRNSALGLTSSVVLLTASTVASLLFRN